MDTSSFKKTSNSATEVIRAIRKASAMAMYFAGFLTAYCAPMLLYGLDSTIEDSRVRKLLDAVLANTEAQRAITTNLITHLFLLATTFIFLIWLADNLARLTSTHTWAFRTLMLILGWLLMLAGNATLFPHSKYTFAFPFLNKPWLAGVLSISLAITATFFVLRSSFLRKTLLATAVAGSTIYALNLRTSDAANAPQGEQRNVIIIGIDSLSFVAFEKLRNELPTLNSLLSNGVYYERAYTPLGRTFPAWTSILSGKNPADHGALFNLRNLEQINKQILISTQLQKSGYHTVFAIDERRFNNMDETFGFDTVIGPAAGALDFVMQQTNDAPLTNLLLQTPLAKSLIKFSYINTQSVPNYDADAFVEATLSEADTNKPLLLAVHFESAHYPYETRHATETFQTANRFWDKQAAALTVVDQQVSELINGLKQRNKLNNALLIVLSDHGEGLGYKESDLELPDHPLELSSYGHGTRLLSDHQNHIILGVTEYKNGKPITKPGSETSQVSLLDIYPLIKTYAHGATANLEPHDECIIIETGLRLSEADDYRTLDPAKVAAGSARFYEIDTLGRMRIREDQLPDLVKTKDIGVRCLDRITMQSFATQKFVSVQLDKNGIAQATIAPPSDDIARINSYRAHLNKSLNTKN